jgi:uncharacterized protein (TIGR02246 family)
MQTMKRRMMKRLTVERLTVKRLMMKWQAIRIVAIALVLWVGLVLPAPALAGTAGTAPLGACVATTEKDIAQLFDDWNQALQTGDPDAVVATYAQDALLLPTMSNMPRDTPSEIRDYFVHFLAGKPVGRIDERLIRIGCNTAMDSGLYTFTLNREGKTVDVPARYTFEYAYQDGKWLIVGHHSSRMPEG